MVRWNVLAKCIFFEFIFVEFVKIRHKWTLFEESTRLIFVAGFYYNCK